MGGTDSRPGRGIPAVNYSLRCHDCRYRRNFGNSPLSCSTKVTAHVLKQHHRVSWFINGVRQETVNPSAHQNVLPYPVDKRRAV